VNFYYEFEITREAVQDFVKLSANCGVKITKDEARNRNIPILLRKMNMADIQVSDDLSDKLTFFIPEERPSIAILVHDQKKVVRRIVAASDLNCRENIQTIAEKIFPVPPPPVNMEKVIFSLHSLDRFKVRFNPRDADTEKSARAVLVRSTEENLPRVNDLLRKRYDKARYFRTDTKRFRFILVEKNDKLIVATFKST
jgi:hypothetical protein